MNSNSFNAASNSKKHSHLPIAPKPPPQPPPKPPPQPPPKPPPQPPPKPQPMPPPKLAAKPVSLKDQPQIQLQLLQKAGVKVSNQGTYLTIPNPTNLAAYQTIADFNILNAKNLQSTSQATVTSANQPKQQLLVIPTGTKYQIAPPSKTVAQVSTNSVQKYHSK